MVKAAEACLNLTSSTGTRLYLSVLNRGNCYPEIIDFLIQDILVPGDTALVVAPLSRGLKKGEVIKLYQVVMSNTFTLIGTETVAADTSIGSTTVPIKPATNTVLTGDYGRSLGMFELQGIESSPFQSQTELNQITLLNSAGWMSKSPSQSSWNIQLTGYIPINTETALGYRLIKNAFFSKASLYIERHFASGYVKAGTTVVSSFSDQVQNAGFVQYQTTLEGHNSPELDLVLPREETASPNPNVPQPTVVAIAPKAGLINEAQTLSATASVTGDTINSVQFQVNSVNEGVADTASPYSTSWTPTVKGSYSIRAIASAVLGGTSSSSIVNVSIYDTKVFGGSAGAGTSLGSLSNNYILFDNKQSLGGTARTMNILVNGILVAVFNYTDTAYSNQPFAYFNSANNVLYTGTIQGTVEF